ncbi:MAG TPA: hypothetical protein VFO85_04600, partial [Vicinamibacteria bacterium]|nr:hypothetical protein [Vicinamibacteria bacterium]
FLRRLGHGEAPALLAVLAFAASEPVAEAVRVPFLGEPVALALKLGFVVALEAGAGVPVLGLLLALVAYAKESALYLLPLVFLVRQPREGSRGALRAALLAGAAPALVMLGTRFVWTPYLHPPRPVWNLELLRAAWDVFRETWRPTVEALLLHGLLPLALLGALRRRARPYLARYGYAAALFVAVSLAAWLNVPSARPVPLFSANTLRILIYALPFLLPLALIALDRVWPHMGEPAPPGRPRRLPNLLAAAAALVLALVPVFALDPYRRAPLHETRDGPMLRATTQETLRTARRLSRGETVTFDPALQHFAWGVDGAAEAHRMRWFLRRGWGPLPHYGTGDVVMQEAEATLLLPCLVPRELQVELTLEAPAERRLRAFVNGAPVGLLVAGPGGTPTALRLPAALLYRGDNVLTLAAGGGEWAGVTLRRVALGPAP